ncbi:MAG: PEP-CTERM sorting domain-containing protein [Oscillatoriaceae cyanobacterium Prado104]|jgi:hypothetical protein|nr:PEP-CTERM sorting domain-containing protein [Oscillatoriaceae cyanobacterium Prado104]
MNLKQKQRVGSAIASTILSCAALSLAVVDKAQAAVLTYNFQVAENGGSGFFKFNNSSLARIGVEEISVSEGRFNTSITATFPSPYGLQGKDYYDLAGATALFFQGEFRGLRARGSDSSTREINFPGDELVGPYYTRYDGGASWSMDTNGLTIPDDRWASLFSGYNEVLITTRDSQIIDRGAGRSLQSVRVSYNLVDTAEPVPEPITVAGTALALAGLSWLKHKKKTAV